MQIIDHDREIDINQAVEYHSDIFRLSHPKGNRRIVGYVIQFISRRQHSRLCLFWNIALISEYSRNRLCRNPSLQRYIFDRDSVSAQILLSPPENINVNIFHFSIIA